MVKTYDGVERTVYVRRIYGTDIDYVVYQGEYVRPRHLNALLAAARHTPGWGELRIMQGGLSRRVGASAGTHALLDVADIQTLGRSKALVWEFCRNRFETNGLPFPRGYTNDTFQNNKHIHDLNAPATFGHEELQDQWKEWDTTHGDGLIGTRPYTGPNNRYVTTWKGSMFNPANRVDEPSTRYVNVAPNAVLLGLRRDRTERKRRPRGHKLDFVAKVYRWGRWNYVTKYETFYAADYLSAEPTG